MNAYVHDQAIINERRMKEMEEQMKAHEAAALAASAAPTTIPAMDAASVVDSNNAAPIGTTISQSSTAVSPTETLSQAQLWLLLLGFTDL